MSSRGAGRSGRGAYYKNKYGRGGRAEHSRGRSASSSSPYSSEMSNRKQEGGTYRELCRILQNIDGKQYPSYHDIETSTALGGAGWIHSTGFVVQIGRTQSDPFAPPTRCRVFLPEQIVKLSNSLHSNKIRRIALADYLWRSLYNVCQKMGADQSLQQNGGWSSPKGGDVQIMEPTQHVMDQSAVQVDGKGNVAIHLTISLPARGRTVLSSAAERIFDTVLGTLIRDTCLAPSLDHGALLEHVQCIEDQAHLQSQLERAGLVAFVRNGAVLPRMSGVDDRPMGSDNDSSSDMQSRVPFVSPSSLECEFRLLNQGIVIKGMGIPRGVTLICGGGFHGKSTLLQALQFGVYWKVPGDGREFCLTSPSAVKIRAEDGRSVNDVDISPFIKNLPFGKDTTCFHTPDASGSTSQAANIVEVRCSSGC